MTKEIKEEAIEVRKKNRPADHTSPDWKGYTLEELTYRMEVNKIKQQIIVERLESTFTAMKEANISRTSGFMSRFNSISMIADYGVIGFKIFTKLRGLYKSFRK